MHVKIDSSYEGDEALITIHCKRYDDNEGKKDMSKEREKGKEKKVTYIAHW